MKAKRKIIPSFEEAHPNIAHFVEAIGYSTIGHDADRPLTSFIQAIDPGGMVWEGKDSYRTLEEAFQDCEASLGKWMRAAGIE